MKHQMKWQTLRMPYHNDIHMHPAQYPSRRRQFANLDRQYCEQNDRRLVRIRNPQYITPHTSRRQVNHVHQLDENYEYHVATSPSLRFKTGNQSSVSATPRRGPWRYMEVNNQWNPPDSHPHLNDNSFSSYIPSQDTLRDEFDGREFDMGLVMNQNEVDE